MIAPVGGGALRCGALEVSTLAADDVRDAVLSMPAVGALLLDGPDDVLDVEGDSVVEATEVDGVIDTAKVEVVDAATEGGVS